jgi:hypothetical protein
MNVRDDQLDGELELLLDDLEAAVDRLLAELLAADDFVVSAGVH